MSDKDMARLVALLYEGIAFVLGGGLAVFLAVGLDYNPLKTMAMVVVSACLIVLVCWRLSSGGE